MTIGDDASGYSPEELAYRTDVHRVGRPEADAAWTRAQAATLRAKRAAAIEAPEDAYFPHKSEVEP